MSEQAQTRPLQSSDKVKQTRRPGTTQTFREAKMGSLTGSTGLVQQDHQGHWDYAVTQSGTKLPQAAGQTLN